MGLGFIDFLGYFLHLLLVIVSYAFYFDLAFLAEHLKPIEQLPSLSSRKVTRIILCVYLLYHSFAPLIKTILDTSLCQLLATRFHNSYQFTLRLSCGLNEGLELVGPVVYKSSHVLESYGGAYLVRHTAGRTVGVGANQRDSAGRVGAYSGDLVTFGASQNDGRQFCGVEVGLQFLIA